MAKLTLAKRVDAPIEEVWASWNDFGDIYKFNPSLKHSRLLSDKNQPTGVGSERHCDLADNKNWIRERIVDHQPLRSITIDAYESSMPLKTMLAKFDFEKISAQRTRVRMTVEFQPKFGVIGSLMVPIMKRQFRGLLQALLDCNAAHVERGEVVPAAA